MSDDPQQPDGNEPPPYDPTGPNTPGYPPPGYPAPGEPGLPGNPATSDRNRNLIVAGAVVAVLLVVGLVLLLTGGDDDPDRVAAPQTTSTPSSGSEPSEQPGDEPSDEPSGDASRPAVEPATGPVVTAPESGVSINLPADWRGASFEQGSKAAAAELYPDDEERATAAEELLGNLPEQALIVGLDLAAAESGAAFTANLNVLADSSVPSSYDLQRGADAEARGLGQVFRVGDRQRLVLGEVETERIQYTSRDKAFAGTAYIIKEAGAFYVLTYTFPENNAESLARSDGSASTFRVR